MGFAKAHVSKKGKGLSYRDLGFAWLCGILLFACGRTQPQMPEISLTLLETPYAGQATWEGGEHPPEGSLWWESFGSRELNALVAEALAHNLEIREAMARLDAAAAAWDADTSAFWPEFTLSAEVGQQRLKDSETGRTRTVERYGLQMGASYEVDLWGRVAAAEAAEGERFRATAEDLESLSMTVAATMVEIWTSHQQTLALLGLVERQLGEEEALLSIEEARFAQGLASALDVLQQREVLLSMRSRLPELRADLRMQAHRMALLTAKSPSSFLPLSPDIPQALWTLPTLPEPGLPLELLEKRPDIRAAKARVMAAGWDSAAAEALRLPRISLSGKGGFSAAGLHLLGQGWLLDAAAGMVLPVFDGGGRRADVRRTQALLRERLGAYERAVLTAVGEVEDALVQEVRQQALLRETELRLDAARITLEEALRRYAWGGDNFDAVLAARSRIRDLEERRVSQKAGQAQARIGLHRALGGWWE
jgi:NodT family efflux transporter outer membrane factor (OMF) lipoprotein